MAKSFLSRLFQQAVPKRRFNARDLMRRESQIGSLLFGEIPAGRRRDFFCLDEHTWVWHEGWLDKSGKQVGVTTRYEIHPDRIIKIQDGQPNRILDNEETNRLLLAAQWYYHYVAQSVYGLQA